MAWMAIFQGPLQYRTTRQVRHLSDLDEVYWNVTGNGWAFPIRQVSASITLPAPVGFVRSAFYTGPLGATGQDARVIDQDERRIRFETARSLAVGEGLTVAAAFQPGLVPAQDANAGTLRLTLDNLGFFALVGLPPLLGIYLFIRWVRVGRDPPKGVIIPLFAPPADMSLAVASWVYWRGTGAKVRGVSRALVAALMSLAVGGRVILMEHSPGLTIERARKRRGADDSLAPEERILEDDLIGRTGSIIIERANDDRIRDAVTNFDNTLNRAYAGKYYRFNWGSIAIGAVLSLLAAMAFFLLYAPNEDQMVIFFAALGVGVIGGNLLVRGVRRIAGDTPGAPAGPGWIMAAIGLLVLSAFVALLAWPDPTAHLLGQAGLPLPPAEGFALPATRAVGVAVLAIVLLNMAFGVLLFAPTPLGRKGAEDLAGFRHSLEVAEAERMNLPGKPDFTTELFERYLPYAIGLGVEKHWARALDAHLASGLPGDHGRYDQPNFYSGRDFEAARIGASTAAIASTLGRHSRRPCPPAAAAAPAAADHPAVAGVVAEVGRVVRTASGKHKGETAQGSSRNLGRVEELARQGDHPRSGSCHASATSPRPSRGGCRPRRIGRRTWSHWPAPHPRSGWARAVVPRRTVCRNVLDRDTGGWDS